MKLRSASTPPADAPIPTTGVSALFSGAASGSPLFSLLFFRRFIPQQVPFVPVDRLAVPSQLAHHFGIVVVLLGTRFELRGQRVVMKATLMFGHPTHQRRPFLMGTQ